MQSGNGGTAEAGKEDLTRMVTPALEAELARLPKEVQASALAAAAQSVAQVIDDGDTSATAKASLYKVYLDILDRLRVLVPEQQEDELDAIRKRLDRRTAS